MSKRKNDDVLRLTADFFKLEEVVMLESMPGGTDALAVVIEMMAYCDDDRLVMDFDSPAGIDVFARRIDRPRERVIATVDIAEKCGLCKVDREDGWIKRIAWTYHNYRYLFNK